MEVEDPSALLVQWFYHKPSTSRKETSLHGKIIPNKLPEVQQQNGFLSLRKRFAWSSKASVQKVPASMGARYTVQEAGGKRLCQTKCVSKFGRKKYFQPSIDKRQIDELATMRLLENGENVVFLGPPGVGKTHLTSALGLVAAQHRFSTYYINCHQLIEQLKKAHFENRLPDKLRVLAKYRMLIIDEIGYLPMDIQGANLFFQLIARRYEKTSTVFTSNKTFSQCNEVFADVTIASAILDRVLHHCTVINIKGDSYRLKERKEFMRQKQ